MRLLEFSIFSKCSREQKKNAHRPFHLKKFTEDFCLYACPLNQLKRKFEVPKHKIYATSLKWLAPEFSMSFKFTVYLVMKGMNWLRTRGKED
jgi:hypothetical protein